MEFLPSTTNPPSRKVSKQGQAAPHDSQASNGSGPRRVSKRLSLTISRLSHFTLTTVAATASVARNDTNRLAPPGGGEVHNADSGVDELMRIQNPRLQVR